jgi:hypothetical protein
MGLDPDPEPRPEEESESEVDIANSPPSEEAGEKTYKKKSGSQSLGGFEVEATERGGSRPVSAPPNIPPPDPVLVLKFGEDLLSALIAEKNPLLAGIRHILDPQGQSSLSFQLNI